MTDEIVKVCTLCKEEKDVNLFYTKNGGKYLMSRCKACTNKIYASYNKKSRKGNPKFLEWNRAYKKRRMENLVFRDRTNELKRENCRKNMVTRMFKAAEKRALKNNLEFSLKKEDIIIPDKCPILEIPIYPGVKGDYKNSPSLDRIDNLKGYTADNTRVISCLANTMKNCASRELLILFCKNIPTYINNEDIVRTIDNQESIELKDKELSG